MILTIMLWLGMQGQAVTVPPPTQTYSCVTLEQAIYFPYVPLCEPVPAVEHVFEIRTKREDHGTAKDERSHGLGGTPHCDDPEDVLESPNQCHEGACFSVYIAPHCVRLTRELWMDGKRLGIVKGLEP